MAHNKYPQVDIKGLNFTVYGPRTSEAFLRSNARAVLDLAHAAFTYTLGKTFAGDKERAARVASAITHRDRPVDYTIESLADPSVAVARGEFNPALFTRQRLVVARRRDEIVGLSLSMDTSSGPLSTAKMLAPPGIPVPVVGGKRYAAQRLEVVRPDERGHGVAEVIGDIALAQRHNRQNATAYTWPELLPRASERLLAYAFEEDGSVPQTVGGESVERVRYVGQVEEVRAAMRDHLPDLDEAVESVWDQPWRMMDA